MRPRFIVLLLALTATATACGAAHEVASPSQAAAGAGAVVVPTPFGSFGPGAGWFTAETSEPPDPQGHLLPVAWAANMPFTDDPAKSGWPDRTIRELPAGGIVLEAVGPWGYTGEEDVPTFGFPLTLADGYCLANGYEGQPAPNVSFCAIVTRIDAEIMNAYVYFGRNEPTPEMKAEANEVLATLSISR